MNLQRIVRLVIVLMLVASIETQALHNQYDNCCEEVCNYLIPCDFSVQVHAGVNPIIWAQRNDDCCINGAELPSFRHLFKLPWIVGGKFGYNLTPCAEIYVEGNYTQAKGKKCDGFIVNCPQSVNGTTTINSELHKYKAFAFYGGARYYFGSDCLNQCSCFIGRAAFFIGMQVGFVHHKKLDVTLSATSLVGNVSPFIKTIFLKNNTISAGGNFGLDLAFNDCFSLVFTVEVIGNGATKNCPILCLDTPLPGINANTIVVGRYGTEIWIPITLGLKYNF